MQRLSIPLSCVALKKKIRKPPVYHQAASYVGIALKHTQFDCNTIISTACGCVKQILSTTFGGIRGVGAEFLRKCSSGSLEKNLAFPIQSLWDYFFEEPKNGGLFAFLQQKLWDLVYQQSSSYTKRVGHRAWRPALFFAYITLFCLCRHHTVPESLRLHAGCSCRIPREHSSHQR